MVKQLILDWIKQYRVIATVKGVGSLYIEDTVKALYDGGIRIVEITLSSNDSLKSITTIRESMKGKIVCGAGYVMSADSVENAFAAGAQFISCIHSDPKVICKASEMGRAVIAGAYTPTDIISALECKADFINIFPAISVGHDYFRHIRSPFSDKFFFASGGIDTSNATGFLKAGANGIAVGTSLVNPRFIKENNYKAITDAAQNFVEIIKSVD